MSKQFSDAFLAAKAALEQAAMEEGLIPRPEPAKPKHRRGTCTLCGKRRKIAPKRTVCLVCRDADLRKRYQKDRVKILAKRKRERAERKK